MDGEVQRVPIVLLRRRWDVLFAQLNGVDLPLPVLAKEVHEDRFDGAEGVVDANFVGRLLEQCLFRGVGAEHFDSGDVSIRCRLKVGLLW